MLGECHAHIFMDGVDYKKAVLRHRETVDEQLIGKHLEAYRKRSISYIRDGGDAYGVSQRASVLAPEFGITYRTPIFALHKRGEYGSIAGHAFDDLKEYYAKVKEVRRLGGHFIKIMLSGIMDFNQEGAITGNSLPLEMVREMIHIAHEEGFAVMAHTNGATAMRNAVLSGVDSIEHGYGIDDACIEVMADSEVVWVPTVTPVKNLIEAGRFSKQVLGRIVSRHKDNIKKAYQKGVQLGLGSDAGAYGVKHGQGTFDEYQALKEILSAQEGLDIHLAEGERRIRNKF